MLDQGRAGGRGPQAPAVADDQRGARLRLQRGHRLRDRGLGVGQRVRGGRERALDHDLPQHPEPLHVQHKHYLYRSLRTSLVLISPEADPCW